MKLSVHPQPQFERKRKFEKEIYDKILAANTEKAAIE